MKTNLDHLYKTNSEMEKEGNWFELAEGVALKITRFGGFNSANIKKALAKYYKPYARQIEMGTLAPELEKSIMNKVFVESCVKDWKGIEIEGEQVPFSIEKCVDLFNSLPDMADTLITYASDYKNFKEEVGNS